MTPVKTPVEDLFEDTKNLERILREAMKENNMDNYNRELNSIDLGDTKMTPKLEKKLIMQELGKMSFLMIKYYNNPERNLEKINKEIDNLF